MVKFETEHEKDSVTDQLKDILKYLKVSGTELDMNAVNFITQCLQMVYVKGSMAGAVLLSKKITMVSGGK